MRPFATLLYLALFANFVWMAGHDQQRLVEIGALLAVGVAVPVLRPSTVAGLWTNRANRSLVVFFMLGVLGGVVAFAPRLAFCEISILFLLYVWSLALAEDIADQVRRRFALSSRHWAS